MRKKEIDRKLEEIIDFSGVERYIDTPVKRYSSGMYVRLAFAVAAHLESEILIVDEVLAVGDAEFQKKCLGKMGEVSKGEGRTVLFVSHNMAAVQSLCEKGMLLQHGELLLNTNCLEIVNTYLEKSWKEIGSNYKYFIPKSSGVFIREIKIINNDKNYSLLISEEIVISIEYEIVDEKLIADLSMLLTDKNENKILQSIFKTERYKKGVYHCELYLPSDLLNNIDYVLTLGISTLNPVEIHETASIKFSIEEDFNSTTRQGNDYKGKYHGCVRPKLNWKNI
jgi:lipopolysaccharide transport system ATP-binding protein